MPRAVRRFEIEPDRDAEVIERMQPIEFNNIVLAGMGDSGSACEVVGSFLLYDCGVLVQTWHSGASPRFLGGQTLVVGVSVSGNTQEIFGLLNAASQVGATVAAVSGPGRISELVPNARRRGPASDEVDGLIVSVVGLLCDLLPRPLLGRDISDAGLISTYLDDDHMSEILIASLASTKLVLLVGSGRYAGLANAACRLVQERTHLLAIALSAEELPHILLTGFASPAWLSEGSCVVALIDGASDNRFSVIDEVLSSLRLLGVDVILIEAGSLNPLERAITFSASLEAALEKLPRVLMR